MRGRTDLIPFGLVRRRHVSQILDHLLGVLRLTSTRLSSVRATSDQIIKIIHELLLHHIMLEQNSRAKNGLVFTICKRDQFWLKALRTTLLEILDKHILSRQCKQEEQWPQTGNQYPASCVCTEVLLLTP